MSSRQVLAGYLWIAGLYTLSASLIWGVNTLFLLDAGLSLFEVFVANAFFTAGMVLFEIPTGVVADTRGRRVSFLLSVFVLFVGTIGYVNLAHFGLGVVWFSAVSVVLGLGFTFYSGAVEAWLVDALDATGFDGDLDSVFARGAQVTGLAMLVGTVGGGWVGGFDLAYPFVVRSALLALLFVLAFVMMREVGFTRRPFRVREVPRELRTVAEASMRHGWNQPAVRLLMVFSFVQMGFFAWAWYAWQPYFLALLGQNLVWVAGVIAALVSLASILGNRIVGVFSRACRRRTTMLLWAAGVMTVCMVGVGLASSFYVAVGLFLVAMVAMGVIGPVKQAYLHQKIPSAQRATVVSFDGMMGSGGAVVGQLGLARYAQTAGIGAGYVAGGLVTGLGVPLFWALRRRGEAADRIKAAKGLEGPCAGSGLPSVAEVDPNRVTDETGPRAVPGLAKTATGDPQP